jgi:hypothetical protein
MKDNEQVNAVYNKKEAYLMLVCQGVHNSTVVALARRNPGLKHLVLDECDAVTAVAIKVYSYVLMKI